MIALVARAFDGRHLGRPLSFSALGALLLAVLLTCERPAPLVTPDVAARRTHVELEGLDRTLDALGDGLAGSRCAGDPGRAARLAAADAALAVESDRDAYRALIATLERCP